MKTSNEYASALTIGSLLLSVCVVSARLLPMTEAESSITSVPAGLSSQGSASSREAPVLARLVKDEPPVAARCEHCGGVASVRETMPAEGAIDAQGKPGLIMASLKDTAVEPARRDEVTVLMQYGSPRVFANAVPADRRTGERLILTGGAVHANK